MRSVLLLVGFFIFLIGVISCNPMPGNSVVSDNTAILSDYDVVDFEDNQSDPWDGMELVTLNEELYSDSHKELLCNAIGIKEDMRCIEEFSFTIRQLGVSRLYAHADNYDPIGMRMSVLIEDLENDDRWEGVLSRNLSDSYLLFWEAKINDDSVVNTSIYDECGSNYETFSSYQTLQASHMKEILCKKIYEESDSDEDYLGRCIDNNSFTVVEISLSNLITYAYDLSPVAVRLIVRVDDYDNTWNLVLSRKMSDYHKLKWEASF
jgi:hypothetical protein